MVRTRRGFHLLEWAVAIAVALVVVPALVATSRADTDLLRAALEAETARLILEGELARARKEAALGRLAPGERAFRVGAAYPSAAQLEALVVRRRVAPAGDGLLEVALAATWKAGAAGDRRAPRELKLASWIAPGGGEGR